MTSLVMAVFAIVITVPPSAAAYDDATIKKALIFVSKIDCANLEPIEQEQVDIVTESKARIMPLLLEMLADDSLTTQFYAYAGWMASQEPVSNDFRAALRIRRDDPRFRDYPSDFLSLFHYFSVAGDVSDLRWMKSAKKHIPRDYRDTATESIHELKERLKRGVNS